MNDKEYLEKMCALTYELEVAASAEPYDPTACKDIMAQVNALHMCKFYSRRRRPWSALITVIMLLIVLLWIVFEVLSLLWMRGTL